MFHHSLDIFQLSYVILYCAHNVSSGYLFWVMCVAANCDSSILSFLIPQLRIQTSLLAGWLILHSWDSGFTCRRLLKHMFSIMSVERPILQKFCMCSSSWLNTYNTSTLKPNIHHAFQTIGKYWSILLWVVYLLKGKKSFNLITGVDYGYWIFEAIQMSFL